MKKRPDGGFITALAVSAVLHGAAFLAVESFFAGAARAAGPGRTDVSLEVLLVGPPENAPGRKALRPEALKPPAMEVHAEPEAAPAQTEPEPAENPEAAPPEPESGTPAVPGAAERRMEAGQAGESPAAVQDGGGGTEKGTGDGEAAPAADPDGSGSAPHPRVTDAEPRVAVSPVYPVAARRRGVEGTVILSVETDEHGTPVGCTVIRSSGHPALDRAAREAAVATPFIPATVNGVPTRAVTRVTVHFRLR